MQFPIRHCLDTPCEEFKKFSSDPVMREKVRARERYLNDERLKIAGAKREGRTEEKIEVARNMKNDGVDPQVIAKYTALVSYRFGMCCHFLPHGTSPAHDQGNP